jgi:hypothetical protein
LKHDDRAQSSVCLCIPSDAKKLGRGKDFKRRWTIPQMEAAQDPRSVLLHPEFANNPGLLADEPAKKDSNADDPPHTPDRREGVYFTQVDIDIDNKFVRVGYGKSSLHPSAYLGRGRACASRFPKHCHSRD